MKTKLDFAIEELDYDELLHELELYPALRGKIRADTTSRNVCAARLNAIRIAELNTRIAILHSLSMSGRLEAALAPGSRLCPATNWGSDNIHFFCSNICKMLSELSVDHIAYSAERTDHYHNLTEIIDGSRRKKEQVFIKKLEFWEEYFLFYKLYFTPDELLSDGDDDDDYDDDDDFDDDDDI